MNILFSTVFGSHLYGTNIESSDRDTKAVYLPSRENILLQRVKDSINTNSDDQDFESFSLQKFLSLLMQGQTVALDMLFAPESFWLGASDVWREIVAMRPKLIHCGASAFVGYCKTQAGKYCVKGDRLAALQSTISALEGFLRDERLSCFAALVDVINSPHVKYVEHPGANGESEMFLSVCDRQFNVTCTIGYVLDQLRRLEGNYGKRARMAANGKGIDWKALMHAVRVANEAVELLATHRITFPRPEAEMLLKIRKGELPYPEVTSMIEEGLRRVGIEQSASSLPKKPNRELCDGFVLRNYGKAV